MNIEEAKDILNHYLEMEEFDDAGDFLIAIDVILSELEKKEAIINEMAKTINKEYYKDIIENYTKKVEGKQYGSKF